MQGFAVIDSQPDSSVVVVWHTTRVGATDVEHTNAVALDLDLDPSAQRKVHSLTRDRVVLITDGSTVDRLPLAGVAMTTEDIDALVTETVRHQERILSAVEDYVRQTRKYAIVRPTFSVTPVVPASTEALKLPTDRALSVANYLATAWRRWLKAEEERLRRTTDGNGTTPWMMPPELGGQELAELPIELASRAVPEPLEVFDA